MLSNSFIMGFIFGFALILFIMISVNNNKIHKNSKEITNNYILIKALYKKEGVEL